MNSTCTTSSHHALIYTMILSIVLHVLGVYWWLQGVPTFEATPEKKNESPLQVYFTAIIPPLPSAQPTYAPDLHPAAPSKTSAPPIRRPSSAQTAPSVRNTPPTEPTEALGTAPTKEVQETQADASTGQSDRSVRVIARPKPPYPRQSTQLQEEGTVVLSIFIEKTGRVAEVKILQSSGFPRLDSAAQQTVAERWLFEPEHQQGEAVAVWYQVPITFALTH